MENMVIETKLFGKLAVCSADGLFEEYHIILNGKEITTNLYLMEEFLSIDNLKLVEHFIENIPLMHKKAKETIMNDIDSNEVVKYFYESSIEETPEESLYEIFRVATINDISKARFVEALEPRGIRVGINSENKIDCTFDFSLDKEYTDELLVIYFNSDFEITDISHES